MKHLVILGGGHAGSSAALSAAKHLHDLNKEHEICITLIDKSSNLTIRPRLYEYELETTQIPFEKFLTPIDVEFICAEVRNINFSEQIVTYKNDTSSDSINYGALIIALGSELAHPKIPGIETVHNIDSYASAYTFRETLEEKILKNNQAIKIAILGGCITGLELATEIPVTINKISAKYKRNFLKPNVYLIDRHQITQNFGTSLAPVIKDALSLANVQCINEASIQKINSDFVTYNNDQALQADIIVSTLGMRANKLSQNLPFTLDSLGRVFVNNHLQSKEYDNCFVAGDIAHAKPDNTHDPIMSCQQGRPQGRYAGYNAISYLLDEDLVKYSQPNYVTCIDLGEYGAAFSEGWDRELVKYGIEAKKIKTHINQDRIYPPNSSDKETLLQGGTLEFVTPSDSIKKNQD
jgi:NADH dehydrogenase